MAEYMFFVVFEASDGDEAAEVVAELDAVLDKLRRDNTRTWGTVGARQSRQPG